MALTSQIYPGVSSDATKTAKRKQLKSMMDNFSTFSWDGYNAFDSFGAFIINDRNGLKFYNGPTFSNTYSKPQFSRTNATLSGVSFNQQKIQFTIGVYWITEEDYRLFLNWLNPYVIGNLCFGYDSQYRYVCKLSNIQDSIRYVLGYTNPITNNDSSVNSKLNYSKLLGGNEPAYYTELQLTFELQGESCAITNTSYQFNTDAGASLSDAGIQAYPLMVGDNPQLSDLPMPFVIYSNFVINHPLVTEPLNITCHVCYYEGENVNLNALSQAVETGGKLLFSIALKNLTYNTSGATDNSLPLNLQLSYDSEAGLLYLTYNNSKKYLASLLNTSTDGKHIVNALDINRTYLPGRFDFRGLDYTKLYFVFQYDTQLTAATPSIEAYGRTNIL